MFRLIKTWFFAGLTFLTDTISLNWVSMNNQQCKARPQIVDVNGIDSVFFHCFSF